MPTLRPHQEKALAKLKNGSILYGGVGSGKGRVACAYYVNTQDKRPVFVITTAKKRDSLDWVGEFSGFGVTTIDDVMFDGVLTVDSWNNIGKYVHVKDAFFIFDEQRLVGSGGWVKNFLKIAKKNNWILLTGTPGDTWLEYIPVFLAHGFYNNRTEFKALHVVYKPYSKFPAVDHYINVGKLVRLRNQIVVSMPFDRHTKRHLVEIPVEFDKDEMKAVVKSRWNPFSNQPLRGAAEMYMVMRKVVNTHPSRLDALYRTLKIHPKIIVFYNFDYELAILRGLEGVPLAEWNGHKHEEIPKTDTWVYLVQFAAGAEGWECIETNATFFWSQNYSFKLWEQAHGRMDRLNTTWTNLFYYLPMTNSLIDRAIRGAILQKRDFNESDLSDLHTY